MEKNNNIYPIAIVVFLIENRETWPWFLRQLPNVIDEPKEKDGPIFLIDKRV